MEDLEKISCKEFQHYEDMYKIVDFLNKNLADIGVAFGLTIKDSKDVITIYKENQYMEEKEEAGFK